MNSATTDKKTFIILWALCILGSWSILPYMQYLQILSPTISVWKVALLSTIQAALLFGCVCWISFKILPKTDLQPFPHLSGQGYLKQLAYPAFISGVLLGLAIFLFDTIIFNRSQLSGVHPPLWAGALASLYGAFNEEVLLRLFLFTLIYFLVGKCVPIDGKNRLAILWCVNILVALLFGVVHLPVALKLAPPSPFEISRVLLLNGIAGVVFGWLYWSKGLWTAIAAHFVTDLMIHLFLI
jgi:membrane protease YdiL (CAAX protease family)